MSVTFRHLEDRRLSQPSGDRRRHEHAIPEPEPAHIQDHDGVPEDEREAIDLHTPAQRKAGKQRRESRVLSPNRSRTYGGTLGKEVAKVWRHGVAISVPHVDCRDHLGRFYLFDLFPCSLSQWQWHLTSPGR